MSPAIAIFLFFMLVAYIIYKRAGEVREELVDEAREEGNLEEAERIEDMSDDEIIEEHDDRF